MTDSSSSDGRRDPRANVLLKVDYADAEGFLNDYTINISRGGTLIRVNRDLSEGDHVDLLLSFPGLLKPIRLTGVVRWTQEEGPAEITAGVEFEEQDPQLWDHVEALVQRITNGDRSVVMPIVRILVVEDNVHIAKLIADGLTAYLKRNKNTIAFETRHATNGKEALELMHEEDYDVLLVDMYLPVMDGHELIQKLRAEDQWVNLPIVALSAGGPDAQERAFSAGADFFLNKPIRLSDILNTIGKLMATMSKSETST